MEQSAAGVTANEAVAEKEAVAETDAVASESVPYNVSEGANDGREVDLTQTSFVDTSISERATDESISTGRSFAGDNATPSDSSAEGGSGGGNFDASLALGAAGAAGIGAGLAAFDTRSDQPQSDASKSTNTPIEAPQDAPPVDPEIVEVFVEEVDEILEAIEAQLPDWSEDLTSVAPITEIRRNFHTLKGSGRIVGANQIGELGWAVENMLNRLMDGTIAPSEDHLFIVTHACRIVPKLRSEFVHGTTSESADLVELLEQVDVLASGGALSSALASSKPALNTPSGEERGDAEDLDSARPPSVEVPSFFSAPGSEEQAASADDARAIFAEEQQEHLEILSARVRESLAEGQLELDSPFTRALHTIAGSAATAGELSVLGIAEPLQDVASVILRERNGMLDGEPLAFVREAVYALQRLLDVDTPSSSALGGLLETEDTPQSLLELDATAVLLDAREYLDAWRFGSLDLERAEQMNRALVTVIERAHSDDFAELAETLHLAHSQFGDQPLEEDRHHALIASHDDLLVHLDALAAGQVANLTVESRERLQDLLSEAGSQEPTAVQEEDEPLSDDAQEALAYTLDKSDEFDLDALDDDVFASDDVAPIEDVASIDDVTPLEDIQSAESIELPQDEELADELAPVEQESVTASLSLAAAGAGAAAVGAAALAGGDVADVGDAEPSATETVLASEEDEVDHELLEIFFEEADEILEEFDHNLQSWSEDRANSAPLDNLLRGLHTLKGGARLAGLSALGDMSHNYESELIEIQNAEGEISGIRFEAVQQSYDELVEAVQRARSGDAPAVEVAAETDIELPAETSDNPTNNFDEDVEAAFSSEALAEAEAEVAAEREQELRVTANEASVAGLAAASLSSEVSNEEADEPGDPRANSCTKCRAGCKRRGIE